MKDALNLFEGWMRRLGYCFLLFGCLMGVASGPVKAHEKGVTPCAVDLIFGDDSSDVFTAFVLKLQHKNTSRRTVTAVSVLIQNEAGEVFKNSDALCNVDGGGIAAGSAGQCEKMLQIITGKMAEKVGYDVWVKMIDDQKEQFLVARKCELVGVHYE